MPYAATSPTMASLLTSLPSSMTKRPLRVIEKHRPLVFILVSSVILVLRLHYLVCSRRRRWASSRQSRVCKVRRRILGWEVFADAHRFPVCKQPLTASPSKVPGDSGRCSHPRQYPRCGQCCCAKRPDCVWWSSCNYPAYPPARSWNDAERAKARHPVSEPFLQDALPPEVSEFEEVRFIDAVDGDLDASLAKMRGAMIGARNFDAAVFLGGMEGVEIEYDIFRRLHPNKPAYPVASAGAAARILSEKYSPDRLELRLFRVFSGRPEQEGRGREEDA